MPRKHSNPFTKGVLLYNGNMNNGEIKEFIELHSNQKYKEFSEALSSAGSYRMKGVRLPVLRDLAKRLVKEDGIRSLSSLSDDCFEEVLLQGFVIGYSKMPMADRIPYINDYINKSDSWNLIDSFVSTVKPKVREREVLWNYLDYIKYSDRPFTVRFVLVMMLNSYLDDEHIDEVLRYTESIQSDHYYVNMAQAWLLATAYINYDDKVNEILERGKLNKFTHNKTIQKAIESYRISDEDKERLKGMRK